MAVKGDRLYHPTEALILQQPRRRYRTLLHPAHFQLRSQISSDKDAVYYLSGTEPLHCQKLDLTTREAETIKHLPFPPRCLVAKNGWICCGGECGEFAAFRMEESNEDENEDTDERIEIDADADANEHSTANSPGDDSMPALLSSPSTSDKSLVARSKSYGKERINCITLWFPPPAAQADQYGGAYQQPVAVLSNNDKRVIIVGLEDQETLDELVYPDCVNRAVLSPDGQLLVAICDDPYLYVRERTPKFGTASLFGSRNRTDFEWRNGAKIHLESQRQDDLSTSRGSFAACFSNSGNYLAVGTQYGVISIFLTASFLVPGVDPLITSFTTSRPDEGAGAVRDMAFCPGPFDMLAWTEHSGRVGIADVRSNYVSRQVLEFNKFDKYEDITISDMPSSIDPRLLGTEHRRATPRRPNADLDRYHSPLTADETMVLEALQEHRRRRDQANAISTSPSTATPRLGERGPGETSTGSGNVLLAGDASGTRGVSDILSNIMNHRERLRDQSERLRVRRLVEESERSRRAVAERMAGRTADQMGHPPPRRAQPLRAADSDGTGTLSQTNGRRTYLTSSGAPGGWAEIEALYHMTGEGPGGSPHETGAGESTSNRQRDRMAFFGSILSGTSLRDWDDPPIRRTNGTTASRYPAANPVDPLDTAGLSWSEDGRVLFVGVADGIYEFHVDLRSRKLFPSTTLR